MKKMASDMKKKYKTFKKKKQNHLKFVNYRKAKIGDQSVYQMKRNNFFEDGCPKMKNKMLKWSKTMDTMHEAHISCDKDKRKL